MSPTFSLPDFDPTQFLPVFHSDDILPLILLVFGMCVSFLGYRVSRFACFLIGFILGCYLVQDLFQSQTVIRHAVFPIIVLTLVSLVSAVTFLLLHVITLSVLVGYIIALFIIAADNGRV